MTVSFILFNELLRFLGEIETDNFTVSNSVLRNENALQRFC